MNDIATKRLLVSSGSPYEPIIGFSRAVRVGNVIAVGGTTAGSSGKPVAIGDPAAQTRVILEIIAKVLQDAGASLKDVIRTRVFLVDIAHWEAVGKVHGEFFGDIRPASSMLEVSRFINPDWLVEIEADAVGFWRLKESAMAPREAKDCRDMDEVRAEIDRIDQALVDLIGERFSYVDRAWQLKRSPAEARVPWRIQQVIDKVRTRAAEKNLPPELAEALWRQMIGWFIQYEEEKLSQSLDEKE